MSWGNWKLLIDILLVKRGRHQSLICFSKKLELTIRLQNTTICWNTFVTHYIEFATIYVLTSVRNSVVSTRSGIYKVETIQSKQLRNEPNLLFCPQTLSLAFYQRQVCVNVYFERSPKSFVFFLDKDYRSIAPALSCNSFSKQ